jgi:parallel beta-helix repeat protein
MPNAKTSKPSLLQRPWCAKLLLCAGLAIASGHVAAQLVGPIGTGSAPSTPPTQSPCASWSGGSDSEINRQTLQAALDNADNKCVAIAVGTHLLSGTIFVGSNKTIRGNGPGSVLKADPLRWTFKPSGDVPPDDANGFEGVLSMIDRSALGPLPNKNSHVLSLKIDGSGVATNGVAPTGTLDNLEIVNARCSGVSFNSTGSVLTNSKITSTAKAVPIVKNGITYLHTCRGKFVQLTPTPSSCVRPKQLPTSNYCSVYVWPSAVDEGAGIYVQSPASSGGYPLPSSLGVVIRNNTISDSYGPALDVNAAWDGTFQNNTVFGNDSWAAVSLYSASNWVITQNNISHPVKQEGQPYHSGCQYIPKDTPEGLVPNLPASAAIFLCQDLPTNNLLTQNNLISKNRVSGYIGILSVGARTPGGYMVPSRNVFTWNDPRDSWIGCVDRVPTGIWAPDANKWIENFCAGGTAGAPPIID